MDVSSRKHRQDLERARERRRAARDEQARRRRLTALVLVGALVAVTVGSAITALVLLRSGDAPTASSSTSATPSSAPVTDETATPSPSPSPADSSQPAAAPAQPVAECAPPGSFRGPGPVFSAAPAPPASPPADQRWTLATNCGVIVVELDPQAAPATVASLDFLSEQGYYDGTFCHRLTTEGIFVLQCGDPTATGTGGPGYQLAEENLPAAGTANYPAGTVAMARAAEPGTTGSQFFLVYDDTTLNPDYTVVGRVTLGLETLQAIAAAGVEGGGADGFPTQPVFISQARVGEAP